MRPGLALAALALLVPAASAGTGCLPPSCVHAHTAAFAPPLVVLQAGQAVQWLSIDIHHTSTEDLEQTVEFPCFSVLYGGANPLSKPVSFGFAGSTLLATTQGADLPCTSADPVPGGALVTYNCRIHPWMAGAVLVLA